MSEVKSQLSATEKALREIAKERILVLDGAWGTMIQALSLDEAGYRGARFNAWNREVRGNNDLLNLSKPDAIRDISLSNSDLAGAWPMAFRESLAGRFFDPERQTPAIGLPISLYGRPTLITTQTDNPYTAVADRMVYVGPVPRRYGTTIRNRPRASRRGTVSS